MAALRGVGLFQGCLSLSRKGCECWHTAGSAPQGQVPGVVKGRFLSPYHELGFSGACRGVG